MDALLTLAPDCPVRALLGFPCPGCGLTRALLLCLRGDFGAAFVMHPMAPILLAQAAVFLVLWLHAWRRRQSLVYHDSLLHLFVTLDCVGMMFVWIARLGAGEIP